MRIRGQGDCITTPADSQGSSRDETLHERSYPADHHYRSKVEILRDFLVAIQESGKKTRIIGLANLNPSSFRPYLRFCLAHEPVSYTHLTLPTKA